MNVGWIGLGSIGTAMAKQLLAAGHDVTAYARGAGTDEVAAAGGLLNDDYADVAAGRDMLGVCVFNDEQLEQALLRSGALAAMRAGSVLVVHTTGSPNLARRIADKAPAGVETLDACFSGGAQNVLEGTLTLMVGGIADGLARARPLLCCYADNILHVGPTGTGQTAKLLNNLLFATNLRFAAEIIRLATDQGLDAAQLARVVQLSSGMSRAMGMFESGRKPEVIMSNVGKYLAKDVAAASATAHSLDLDFSIFGGIVDYYS